MIPGTAYAKAVPQEFAFRKRNLVDVTRIESATPVCKAGNGETLKALSGTRATASKNYYHGMSRQDLTNTHRGLPDNFDHLVHTVSGLRLRRHAFVPCSKQWRRCRCGSKN